MMIVVIVVVVVVIVVVDVVVMVMMMMVVVVTASGRGKSVVELHALPVSTSGPRKSSVDSVQIQFRELMPIQIRRDNVLREASRLATPIRLDLLQQEGQEFRVPMILGRPQNPRPSCIQIPIGIIFKLAELGIHK